MALDCKRLLRFDLVDDLEERVLSVKDPSQIRDFFSTMQEINSIDRFIKDAPSFPGSTDMIIRDELISAIGATLAIEGTVLRKDEIDESFRKAGLKQKLERSEQEAENSRKVYEFIKDLVEGRGREGFKYEEAMVKQVHKYFTDGMNYLSNTPGEYRGDFTVTFGSPRREGLCRGRMEVEQAMRGLIKWLNTPRPGMISGNPIVKAIMAHYYLTEIHPFGDGNGRTARALEALILYEKGINGYCFWSLANFWSRNREKYLIHLGNVYETGDAWPLVVWGLGGFRQELERIRKLVLKKMKQLMLMDYTKYLLETKRKQRVKITKRVVDVMRLLIQAGKVPTRDFMGTPQIEVLYGRSPSKKSRDFAKMRDLRLIAITKEDGVEYIEPNYQILEDLRYSI